MPSQVEKVAEKAGRAAPAVAIAGVLVAVPHHSTAVQAGEPAGATAAFAQQAANSQHAASRRHAANGRHAATTTAEAVFRSYDVRPGDTLCGIAQRYYHNARDWRWVYNVNDRRVVDPNLIYPGERLSVPYDPPANFTLDRQVGRHARVSETERGSDRAAISAAIGAQSRSRVVRTRAVGRTSLAGTLSCAGLEHLWTDAGGSSGQASTAASIAMAESGGSQYATNDSSGTKGYWQISPSWGLMSTYNPIRNAEAAVRISANGANWSPWTTYTSGAYSGRC